MKYRNAIMYVLAVALLTLIACSTTPMREYAGPPPGDQTAVVETGPYTRIEEVDGQRVRSLKVGVLPGPHSLGLRPDEQTQPVREYVFYTWVTGSVDFTAIAGHTYLVYVDFVADKRPVDEQTGSGFVWVGHVVDKSTGKRIANTGELPLGAERRGFPTGGVPAGSSGSWSR